MKKASTTYKLSHPGMTEKKKEPQKGTYEVSFSVDDDLRQLKRRGNISDSCEHFRKGG